MKKMISKFADSLLSREDLKRVKGGYGDVCGQWQQVYHCTTTGFSGGGSVTGIACGYSGYGATYDVNSHWQQSQAMGMSPSGHLTTTCS